ncbi:MAG: CorA family divalent cation transporter, partial [Rubricella sp.]
MTAIVFALGPGGARLDPDSPRAAPTTGFEWWHVDANDPDAAESLDALELPPFAVDAMLAQTTRPFARIEADAVLTILRGVNLNDGADPEDMISIRVHAKANRVVTCTLRRLRALEDCRAGMEAGRVNGPGALLALLARRLGERMEGTLSALLETVTDLEEQIL